MCLFHLLILVYGRRLRGRVTDDSLEGYVVGLVVHVAAGEGLKALV